MLRTTTFLIVVLLIFVLMFPSAAVAHNVSKRDASFVQSNRGPAVAAFLFWENKTDKRVEFHLTTAGFYDPAKMFAGGPGEDLPIEEVK